MALCKLNRFHWHFSDDEAFRLQVECFPQLWQQTQMRGETHLLPSLFGGGIEAGGSYSKADAAALITHAKALNIEVLPEIEVPAHNLALAKIFPETRDPNDTGTEISVQGYAQNAINPAMAKTWEVLSALTTEISEIFPFDTIHLGCDELPTDTWMGSPAAASLMAQHGLETTKDLQGWMMAKLAAQLTKLGKNVAAWEEAAQGKNGGIGHNALLFSWTGQGAGVAAARAGYDIVMTPAQHAYLDMAHSDDPDDWGANWAGHISLADTLNWDPVPPEMSDIAEKVVGVEGTFWSEFTTQDDQLAPMIAPRILGIAVKAWQADATLSAPQLSQLANHYAPLFTKIGWPSHPGL